MAEKSILTDLKVSSKITTNAYHISSDKYQIKIGTPAYPGTNKPSSITWNSDGVSLSQGQAESSGIYIDGDKIVMWSPFDGPFTLYDEDDGSIRFQVDGSSNIYEGTTKLTNRYARFDTAQSLSDAQKLQITTNIGALEKVKTITITAAQIGTISSIQYITNLTTEQKAILENLEYPIIKVDLSSIYTALGIDSPYAWLVRNAVKYIPDPASPSTTSLVSTAYEFICYSNDLDLSNSLKKMGNLAFYYFYEAKGTISTYGLSKCILPELGKITLAHLSHCDNIENGGAQAIQQSPVGTFNATPRGYSFTGLSAGAPANYSAMFNGNSKSEGTYSTSFGLNTYALGYGALTQGDETYAPGDFAFAGGQKCSSVGNISFTYGQGLIASGDLQTIFGKYNASDSNKAFIIGYGDSSIPKNILTVDKNGWLQCSGFTDGTTSKTMTQILSGITPSNMVTTDTEQTISSIKTFQSYIRVYDDSDFYGGTDNFNGHDVDAYYYSKGITVSDCDEGGEYNISYPAKSGTIALTSDIPSAITEISTQYVRLTDLTTGVYKLTYSGYKYIYYYGKTSTNTHTVATGSGPCILEVNRYQNGSTYYWDANYFSYDGSYRYLNNLYSTASSGGVNSVNIASILTSHAYRPIKMNGTQILSSSSSTALGLTAGSGITLTNSSGTVTISASGGGGGTSLYLVDFGYVSGYKLQIITASSTAPSWDSIYNAYYLEKFVSAWVYNNNIGGFETTGRMIDANMHSSSYMYLKGFYNGSSSIYFNGTETVTITAL